MGKSFLFASVKNISALHGAALRTKIRTPPSKTKTLLSPTLARRRLQRAPRRARSPAKHYRENAALPARSPSSTGRGKRVDQKQQQVRKGERSLARSCPSVRPFLDLIISLFCAERSSICACRTLRGTKSRRLWRKPSMMRWSKEESSKSCARVMLRSSEQPRPLKCLQGQLQKVTSRTAC
jgi:hypothetical protein